MLQALPVDVLALVCAHLSLSSMLCHIRRLFKTISSLLSPACTRHCSLVVTSRQPPALPSNSQQTRSLLTTVPTLCIVTSLVGMRPSEPQAVQQSEVSATTAWPSLYASRSPVQPHRFIFHTLASLYIGGTPDLTVGGTGFQQGSLASWKQAIEDFLLLL